MQRDFFNEWYDFRSKNNGTDVMICLPDHYGMLQMSKKPSEWDGP